MFHVATLMPTVKDDKQVLNKKRHVGNDHVNIVWCENYRNYRRNTISSQFNFIQIVIYPVGLGLYRITVQKKDKIGLIYPWIDNMLISQEHLPTFVKLCSIQGFRKSRIQKELPFKSYQNRNEYLKQFGGNNQNSAV